MNPVEKFIPVCLRVFVLEPVLRRNIWWYPFGIILIRHVLLVLLPPLVKVDPEPRNLRKWEMVWLIPSPWLIFYQPTLTRSSPPLAHVYLYPYQMGGSSFGTHLRNDKFERYHSKGTRALATSPTLYMEGLGWRDKIVISPSIDRQ